MAAFNAECMQGVVRAGTLDASGAGGPASGPPPSPQHLFPDDVLVRRRPRSVSLAFLRERELGGRPLPPHALVSWAEGESLRTLDVGAYVPLGSSPRRVRSTISIAFSHDGKFFASTHGDHSVKVFSYPDCQLQVSLDGHPRTPWSVRFHPTDASIVASGCLGGECRLWNVTEGICIRKFRFSAKISCVAFSPTGELLAVTAGAKLHLWRYMQPPGASGHSPPDPFRPRGDAAAAGMPGVLLSGGRDFHMVDFHPSGRLLLTGESNRPPAAENQQPPATEDQFTLRLVVHRFDRRAATLLPDPVLIVPRAVAYNDAGVHISPCGTRLAACVPVEPNSRNFHIAVLSFTAASGQRPGTVLCTTALDPPHVAALTNLKFSASGGHLLAGFSFPRGNGVLRDLASSYDFSAQLAPPALWGQCGAPLSPSHAQVKVVDIFRVCEDFPCVRSLRADLERDEADGSPAVEDEINIAVFAPSGPAADGVLYGTQKGRIRVFRHAISRGTLPHGVCDENCAPSQQSLRLSSRSTALTLQVGRRHRH